MYLNIRHLNVPQVSVNYYLILVIIIIYCVTQLWFKVFLKISYHMYLKMKNSTQKSSHFVI